MPAPSEARERILATALTLFYRDGIRATGIDRLIAESAVTKATFYRHFPGKSDLILAFLEHRHARWMAWFTEALERHGGDADALAPALAEWLRSPDYRGCAFINSVGELGAELPGVVDIARRHKAEMTQAIAALLPASRQRRQQALALAIAVDGAIVHAQFDASPEAALAGLKRLCASLMAEAA
jgi:AcrR family transcriptional regulator